MEQKVKKSKYVAFRLPTPEYTKLIDIVRSKDMNIKKWVVYMVQNWEAYESAYNRVVFGSVKGNSRKQIEQENRKHSFIRRVL